MDDQLDFLKLLEMAKAFSSFSSSESENVNDVKYFDDAIYTTALKAVKSAIPYLHPAMQRQAGILIKMYELQSLMRMYDTAQNIDKLERYDSSQREWRKGILTAIRPHLSVDNRNKIDLLIKLIDMKEIFQVMEGFR